MTAAFEIRVSPMAQAQLETLRAFDHARILDEVGQKLSHEPLVQTRNRKPLEPVPEALAEIARQLFADVTAVWELRVVPWRVAYAVDGQVVHVLWIFRKEHQSTDEALS
jgi:hypothetical protein